MPIPSFVTDDVPTADQVNEYMVNNRFVNKTADESIANSTTLQDDNHLTLPVLSSASYLLQLQILATGTVGSNQGLQWRLTGPAGASFWGTTIGPTIDNTSTVGTNPRVDGFNLTQTNNHGLFGVGSSCAIISFGQLAIGGTAGSLTLQWAPALNSGTAVVVKIGSCMQLVRVG